MKPQSWKSAFQAHQSSSQNWIYPIIIMFALVQLLCPRLAQTHLTQWLGLFLGQLLLTFSWHSSGYRKFRQHCAYVLSPRKF